MRTPSDPECQPISAREYRRKGLWEKLSLAYKRSHYDPVSGGYAHVLSMTYFWLTSVSGLHVMLVYAIPEHYATWQPTSRYYLKLVTCFIFVQISANFLCVRFYDSFLTKTTDRPHHVIEPSKRRGRHARLNQGAGGPEPDVFGSEPKHCAVCDVDVPYRTHHCVICRKCVIKRDHHCFFTGTCIGHSNQRYFVVLNFYIGVGCTWGLYEVAAYLRDGFQPADAWDYLLPVTCFRWLAGAVSTRDAIVVWHAYALWWVGFTAYSMFAWNVFVITLGKTSHEVHAGLPLRSTATVSGRFRAVFGDFWPVNFLFPAVLIFRQDHSGTSWPDLKVRHGKDVHFGGFVSGRV